MDPAQQWTGHSATALRKALRQTTDSFALRLGVAARTVAHWASHPETVPRLAIQEALEEVYDRASPRVRARFEELSQPTAAATRDNSAEALRVAIAVVVRRGEVLLVRRRDDTDGISWQFPAGIIKPRERGGDVAVRETLAETAVHCSVRDRIGSRLHPVTGVMCDYFWCEYLAGEAANCDTVENAGVAWAPRRDLDRFVPRETIYPPLLRMLEEEHAGA
jgi:8-oxo-dGTP diphosphatase